MLTCQALPSIATDEIRLPIGAPPDGLNHLVSCELKLCSSIGFVNGAIDSGLPRVVFRVSLIE